MLANPEAKLKEAYEWVKKNPQKHRASVVKWNKANAERVRVRRRIWWRENSEEELRKQRERRASDPDEYRVYVRNRRGREASGGTHTVDEIQDIYRLQRGKCAYCRMKLGKDFHADHIQPLSKGGSNERRNLQLTCMTCNVRKHAIDPIVFAQRRGLLI